MINYQNNYYKLKNKHKMLNKNGYYNSLKIN